MNSRWKRRSMVYAHNERLTIAHGSTGQKKCFRILPKTNARETQNDAFRTLQARETVSSTINTFFPVSLDNTNLWKQTNVHLL